MIMRSLNRLIRLTPRPVVRLEGDWVVVIVGEYRGTIIATVLTVSWRLAYGMRTAKRPTDLVVEMARIIIML